MTTIPDTAVSDTADLMRRPTPGAVIVKVGTQNTTEDGLSDPMAECDLAFIQEGNKAQIERDSRACMRWRWWEPNKNTGNLLGIGWNTEMFRSNGEMDKHKYHGSAVGTPSIPDSMPTPARYLLEQSLTLRKFGDDLDAYVTHIIQGYDSTGFDPNKGKRLELAEKSFKIMGKQFAQTFERDRFGFAGADINTVHRPIGFPDWNMVRDGLDRLYYIKRPRVRLVSHRRGPIVGVGSQMRHASILATFEIAPPKRG